MKVFQTSVNAMLALICCLLCHCTSAKSSVRSESVFGFLPADLNIKERSTIPALTQQQALEKKMSHLEACWYVLPESELIDFDTNTSLRVIHVPSHANELLSDYPIFARTLSGMRDFINSHPSSSPEGHQPDFLFASAGMYVRAKFRCLDLSWGKAVMMLTQYTQEAHPPPPNSEDLRIWIRGMSHAALRGEGGFCVAADLNVKHPRLKPRDAACAEIEGQDETRAIAKAEKQLESFTDASFTPSLIDIERMLREITVAPVRF